MIHLENSSAYFLLPWPKSKLWISLSDLLFIEYDKIEPILHHEGKLVQTEWTELIELKIRLRNAEHEQKF